nr:hypothetical protein [uncultured Draconibacterium sp.]
MVPEIKNMTPEEILDHFVNGKGEGDLYELVPLLPIAAGSKRKARRILKRIRDKGKTLQAYYPEFDNVVPEGKYIGEIEDGALYLV